MILAIALVAEAVRPDGEIRPTLRLVARRPEAFRPPSREAWRRIGGEWRDGKERPS